MWSIIYTTCDCGMLNKINSGKLHHTKKENRQKTQYLTEFYTAYISTTKSVKLRYTKANLLKITTLSRNKKCISIINIVPTQNRVKSTFY